MRCVITALALSLAAAQALAQTPAAQPTIVRLSPHHRRV